MDDKSAGFEKTGLTEESDDAKSGGDADPPVPFRGGVL